jgi:hypothetical protein
VSLQVGRIPLVCWCQGLQQRRTNQTCLVQCVSGCASASRAGSERRALCCCAVDCPWDQDCRIARPQRAAARHCLQQQDVGRVSAWRGRCHQTGHLPPCCSQVLSALHQCMRCALFALEPEHQGFHGQLNLTVTAQSGHDAFYESSKAPTTSARL